MTTSRRHAQRPTESVNLEIPRKVGGRQVCRRKKFKGIVFADVAGEIALAETLRAAAPNVAVFTPLIGLTKEDLSAMANLACISSRESILEEGSEPWIQPSAAEAFEAS